MSAARCFYSRPVAAAGQDPLNDGACDSDEAAEWAGSRIVAKAVGLDAHQLEHRRTELVVILYTLVDDTRAGEAAAGASEQDDGQVRQIVHSGAVLVGPHDERVVERRPAGFGYRVELARKSGQVLSHPTADGSHRGSHDLVVATIGVRDLLVAVLVDAEP